MTLPRHTLFRNVLIFLSLLMSFVFVLKANDVSAATTETQTSNYINHSVMYDEMAKESDYYKISTTFRDATVEEASTSRTALNSSYAYQQYTASLSEQGYSEVKLTDTFDYTGISNVDASLSATVTHDYFKNSDGDYIVITSVFDNTNYRLTEFTADQLDFSTAKITSNIYHFENQVTSRKKFNFNGKSFACSLGGLATCGAYCAVWGMVNAIAGATCSGLCGVAFAAVCSFA